MTQKLKVKLTWEEVIKGINFANVSHQNYTSKLEPLKNEGTKDSLAQHKLTQEKVDLLLLISKALEPASKVYTMKLDNIRDMNALTKAEEDGETDEKKIANSRILVDTNGQNIYSKAGKIKMREEIEDLVEQEYELNLIELTEAEYETLKSLENYKVIDKFIKK